MSQLTLKTETVAEIVQIEGGALVIRPRSGCKLKLTNFAKMAVQIDGSFLITPLDQQIEMTDAMRILGVPYTTLRRIIELEVIKAFKRSPGRWGLSLASVLEHKEKAEKDPEYWDNLKASETPFQTDLKLG